MFVAKCETSNFSFEAYGKTRREAFKTLRAGIAKHETQYGLEPRQIARLYGDCYHVTQISFGVCYRDNSEVK